MTDVVYKSDGIQFAAAMARAGDALFPHIKDGFHRGIQGFRKEWVPTIKSEGLRRHQRWMFVHEVTGDTVDALRARLFPRKFRRSLAALDSGVTYGPKTQSVMTIPLVRRGGKRGGKGKPKPGYYTPKTFRAKFPKRRLVRKGGTLFEARRKGRGGFEILQPAFHLAKTVTLPPVLNLTAHWSTSAAKTNFVARVQKNLDRGLLMLEASGMRRAS